MVLATVPDLQHPLYGRRVFWNGFDFVQDFIHNFLQVDSKHVHSYSRGLVSPTTTSTDILVLSGACKHCSTFRGLIIYIDGEAGKLQLLNPSKSKLNLIYLGVSEVSLPPDTTHIKLMFGASAFRYNFSALEQALQRQESVNITAKSKFVAYAASKCLPHREKVFDALVKLGLEHDLGEVAALGKCHGSAQHAHTHRDVPAPAAARRNYPSNHLLFQPFRFVLCMENSDVQHYMTEKIFNAYQAGAIPIYWGASSLAADMFHPDTFIAVDPARPAPALARVLQIQRDPALLRRVLRTPVLLRGRLTARKYFAGDIPLAAAGDRRRRKSSLSNYIWGAILQRLPPLTPP